VHTSFTWDGAMARTSWWDGSATTNDDSGPCRVYVGQPAAVYTGVRHTTACSTQLAAAPSSPYSIVWPGQSGSTVKVAQQKLGVSADGVFGSVTRSHLMTWQRSVRVPVSGVLDKPTWHKLVPPATSTPPPPPSTGPVKGRATSRDLTGDGHPDLVLRVASSGRLLVYRGDGSRFTGPLDRGTGWNAFWGVEATGDYTGDGLVDVLGVERSTGLLYLYPGLGDGGFAPRREMGHGWNALNKVTAAGDLSGDGLADVVAVRPNGDLLLYTGNGRGGFVSGTVIGHGWNAFDRLVGIGDLDGDGHDDLLGRVLHSGRLAVYHGLGGGRFRAGADLSGTGWNAMGLIAAAGDVTADGRPDLVAVQNGTGVLWRYTGTPTGVGQRTAIGTGWGSADDLG
jgi:peptidoglycan hydrolase-like protein with peptidoglycan-binding domain